MARNLSNSPSDRHAPQEGKEEAKENRERIEHIQEAEKATFTASSDSAGQGIKSLPTGLHEPLSRANIQMDAQSIHRRYPTSAAERRRLVARMMRAVDSGNDMIAARAAAVLIAAERADNSRLQSAGAGKSGQNPQVNVTVQVASREAAVFGDLAAFREAAEHATKRSKQLEQPAESDVNPGVNTKESSMEAR